MASIPIRLAPSYHSPERGADLGRAIEQLQNVANEMADELIDDCVRVAAAAEPETRVGADQIGVLTCYRIFLCLIRYLRGHLAAYVRATYVKPPQKRRRPRRLSPGVSKFVQVKRRGMSEIPAAVPSTAEKPYPREENRAPRWSYRQVPPLP